MKILPIKFVLLSLLAVDTAFGRVANPNKEKKEEVDMPEDMKEDVKNKHDTVNQVDAKDRPNYNEESLNMAMKLENYDGGTDFELYKKMKDTEVTLGDGDTCKLSELDEFTIDDIQDEEEEDPAARSSTTDAKSLAARGLVNCDACNWRCKWYNVGCKAARALCRVSGVVMEGITDGIELFCLWDKDRYRGRSLIADAKKKLIAKELFTSGDFKGVHIQYCSHFKHFYNGVAPSPYKVILHSRNLRRDVDQNAVLLAHEMVHNKQYRRWGEGGFNCRYSGQLVIGNGFGRSNYIEREAYDYGNKAYGCIENNKGCS